MTQRKQSVKKPSRLYDGRVLYAEDEQNTRKGRKRRPYEYKRRDLRKIP